MNVKAQSMSNVELFNYYYQECIMQAEAEALVTLLRDFPGAKAWVTFSCKVSQFLSYKITVICNRSA